MSRVCKVGYALNAKKLRRSSFSGDSSKSLEKWAGGGLGDILTNPDDSSDGNCLSDGVSFEPLELDTRPCDQPVFDVVLHKLTEDIVDSTEKIAVLRAYLLDHPSIVLVDPIEAVRKVTNRATTCHHLKNIENSFKLSNHPSPVTQPNYFVYENMGQDFLSCMADSFIHFPVICKPTSACGTPDSHTMAVILRADDLHLAQPPCIVQQYCNHDENFHKVYVIGDDVMVYKRPSLPNLHFLENGASNSAQSSSVWRSLVFDSRYNYPGISEFMVRPSLDENSIGETESDLQIVNSVVPSLFSQSNERKREKRGECLSEVASLDQHEFERAARALGKEFGLTLFGFDVIVPRGSSCGGGDGCCGEALVVIDVNFFPSYKEVSDFPRRLRQFLRKRAKKLIE